VLDFGIAKVESSPLEGDQNMTRTGSMLGTPSYMSPEQALGIKAVDYRSDLWSLGVIAFECLTGKRPFVSTALGDLVVKICSRPIPVPSQHGPVPEGFDAWFARATQRAPEMRFESAREMAEALRECVGGALSLDLSSQPTILHPGKADAHEQQKGQPPPEDTFLPSGPAETRESSADAAPGAEPSVDGAAKSAPTKPSEDDAVLQTTSAASAVVRSADTPSPSYAADEGHSVGLVFVVIMGALLIGAAGGIWGVLGVQGLEQRFHVDLSFIPFRSIEPAQRGSRRVDSLPQSPPPAVASPSPDAIDQTGASAGPDETPDATAELPAETPDADPTKKKKKKRKKRSDERTPLPPIRWDWRDDSSKPTSPPPVEGVDNPY
jgi:serine/threonine protein kinase